MSLKKGTNFWFTPNMRSTDISLYIQNFDQWTIYKNLNMTNSSGKRNIRLNTIENMQQLAELNDSGQNFIDMINQLESYNSEISTNKFTGILFESEGSPLAHKYETDKPGFAIIAKKIWTKCKAAGYRVAWTFGYNALTIDINPYTLGDGTSGPLMLLQIYDIVNAAGQVDVTTSGTQLAKAFLIKLNTTAKARYMKYIKHNLVYFIFSMSAGTPDNIINVVKEVGYIK